MLKCQDPDLRILNLEPRSLQLAAPISLPTSLVDPAEFKRRDLQLKLYRVNGGRSSCSSYSHHHVIINLQRGFRDSYIYS